MTEFKMIPAKADIILGHNHDALAAALENIKRLGADWRLFSRPSTEGWESVTYPELLSWGYSIAKKLKVFGEKAKVAVMLPKYNDFLIGATLIGANICRQNSFGLVDEREEFMSDRHTLSIFLALREIKALATTRQIFSEKYGNWEPETFSVIFVDECSRGEDEIEWMQSVTATQVRFSIQIGDALVDDAVSTYSTSGSTGTPKGVPYTGELISKTVGAFIKTPGVAPKKDDLSLVTATWLGGVGGPCHFWYSVFTGTPRMVSSGEPNEMAYILKNAPITTWPTYVKYAKLFLEMLREKPPSLRTIITAGSSPDPETVAELERIGLEIVNCYGQTEGLVGMYAFGNDAFTPMPGVKFVIIDRDQYERDRTVKLITGEGEGLLLRLGFDIDDYFDPEKNRVLERVEVDGELFINTGDVMARDADNRYNFVGRAKGFVKHFMGQWQPEGVRRRLEEVGFDIIVHGVSGETDGPARMVAFMLNKDAADRDPQDLLLEMRSKCPPDDKQPGHINELVILPPNEYDFPRAVSSHKPLPRLLFERLEAGELQAVILPKLSEE